MNALPSARLRTIVPPARSIRPFAVLGATLALLAGTARLQAQTAISNFGQGSGGSANLGFAFNGAAESRTFSFTTGANVGGYNFSSLTLSFVGSTGSPGTLTAGLFSAFNSSSGSSPTGLVSSLSITSGAPGSGGSVVFSGTGTLAASTTYFVSLAAPSATSSGNYYSYTTSATVNEDSGGLAGWSIGDVGYISLGGGAWTDGGGAMMSIQASAVPEPSTYAAMAGAAMLAYAIWRRRQGAALIAKT
ncbi:MAG: hypothetical protein RLZZ15_4620 [Verrucomicrobiota bacterium]|jgi:hypothetical protein